MLTAERTCATVLGRGNGWVLAMLVPPADAGGPARGCAPAALSRGAVAPPCAPWLSGGVGARSAPTNRRALAARRRTRSCVLVCQGEERLRPPGGSRVCGHIDLPRAV